MVCSCTSFPIRDICSSDSEFYTSLKNFSVQPCINTTGFTFEVVYCFKYLCHVFQKCVMSESLLYLLRILNQCTGLFVYYTMRGKTHSMDMLYCPLSHLIWHSAMAKFQGMDKRASAGREEITLDSTHQNAIT